jgi:prephenate dehydrogenase
MTYTPKTIVLYSVGLLGGSIGLALKTSGYKGRIIGLSSPASITAAMTLGCIDDGHPYEDLGDIIGRADCVFLCSPIRVIMQTLRTLGSLDVPEGCIVTDVGSTKSEIVKAAGECLPPHIHFIGGHPMAGAEKRGASAADPYLFQNAIYVLTPRAGTPRPVVDGFAAFLERYLGCRHLFLDPGAHDAIAATVSHVPHLLAVALVNLAASMEKDVPGTLQLAAGGFRDMTRIASGPYALWHDILATNKSRIGPVIDGFIRELTEIKRLLSQDGLRETFESAAGTRAGISSSSKGFMRAPNDIFVVVKDQPGMIALMADACAKKGINIKDIEVLKVREGEGGTIRLAFETKDIAKAAVGLLKGLGMTAWERE